MGANESGFEFLDHTADVKLHAWGPSLEALFRAALDGFYQLLGDLHLTDDTEPVTIDVEASDPTYLLHDWLAELLYVFDTDGRQITDIEFVAMTPQRVTVTGAARQIDGDRSNFDAGVKAVTYHGLDVRFEDGRYDATVILDL
jgi:SHS2 domain-containing protein